MRSEEIGEVVDVGAVFRRGQKPKPRWFVWSNRRHDVKTVEMAWKGKEGEAPLLFFSVTDTAGSVFELRFNQKTTEWRLEKVFLEG